MDIARHIGKHVAQAAVLGILAAGALGLTATSPSAAAGQSATINNCYTQWWNTAWAQRCNQYGSTNGWYTSGIECSAQPDKSFSEYRLQGSTYDVSGDDCIFSASNGWIWF